MYTERPNILLGRAGTIKRGPRDEKYTKDWEIELVRKTNKHPDLQWKSWGWMNRDIIKEESDVLAASGLTMNVVGRHISNAAKQFYLGKLKNDQ